MEENSQGFGNRSDSETECVVITLPSSPLDGSPAIHPASTYAGGVSGVYHVEMPDCAKPTEFLITAWWSSNLDRGVNSLAASLPA
jgi:hypothetical protein